MIIKEDLELLENMFQEKIGTVISSDKNISKEEVLISSYITFPYYTGTKLKNPFLKTVSVIFRQPMNSLKIEIEIIFNTNTEQNFIVTNSKFVDIFKKLNNIKEKNNINLSSYELTIFWESQEGSINKLPTDVFIIPFTVFNWIHNQFSFKLGDIKSSFVGESVQFKYYYYLPQTSGGEIDMKVFGQYLITLILSLINNFSRNISVPIILNSITNKLKQLLKG